MSTASITDSPTHQTAMPSAFPASGTFGVTQRITLPCATPGATIHYTTDGSTPDRSGPTFDAYQLPVLEAINHGDRGVSTTYSVTREVLVAQFIRVQSVAPLDDRTVRVIFTNGEQRDIDLSPYITNGPIFEPIRNDTAFFRSVLVEGGAIAWPNGADIDPDVLYYDGPPPWASERASTAIESR
jgi:hypothetical protein